ncbi:hypothetical protein [Halobacteriovorax sp. JY17]|nr:hypothetical protein [Halobacteriovorax sp. JY17]
MDLKEIWQVPDDFTQAYRILAEKVIDQSDQPDNLGLHKRDERKF